MFPKSLQELIDTLKYLPGVGDKTAERYAFAILNMDEEKTEYLAESIENVKTKIKRCKICNNITEGEECYICLDESRESDVICLVDDPKNIILFEKLGIYSGRYHVLDGLISPAEGVSPDDIGLTKFLNRVKEEKFSEIILALNPSIEGETTSLYIKRLIEDLPIKISKIANGIPLGAEIDYIDKLTLEKALNERRDF